MLRDLLAAGMPVPTVRDDDWAEDPQTVTAMLWSSEDGSATGVRVDADAPLSDRVADISDQLQEWAIEQSRSTWPVCPSHPDGHPLAASTRDGVAVWVCPSDGLSAGPIGAL